jgi:CheY-like chemotaxis protein
MGETTAAHIYEPFFTTKGDKGTGLGLATTHAILREHGGFIACETALGKGTTFSVYLPSDARALSGDALSEGPSPTGTETVLVVDDEPSIRSIVQLMLLDGGFAVKAAASGQDAVDLLSDPAVASGIALILLDVSMPGMPARTLRERVRELAPRARVVYFTGYAFEAADPHDSVLEKPVSQRRLLGTIREVLDRDPAGA